MKRISHYKTYQPHQFCYEKIELSLEFPLDRPDEECFREILDRIEAMAKIAYPWLYEEKKMEDFFPPRKQYPAPQPPFSTPNTMQEFEDQDKTDWAKGKKLTKQAILSAKTKKELEAEKHTAKLYKLEDFYEAKMKELNEKEVNA
jgi:hypothetical protein